MGVCVDESVWVSGCVCGCVGVCVCTFLHIYTYACMFFYEYKTIPCMTTQSFFTNFTKIIFFLKTTSKTKINVFFCFFEIPILS